MRKITKFHYEKQIQIGSTGMVIAEVQKCDAETGEILRRVGLKFFNNLFQSRQKRFDKAHTWTDQLIKDCKANEYRFEVFS